MSPPTKKPPAANETKAEALDSDNAIDLAPTPAVTSTGRLSARSDLQMVGLWLVVVLPMTLIISFSVHTFVLVIAVGLYIGLISYLGTLWRKR